MAGGSNAGRKGGRQPKGASAASAARAEDDAAKAEAWRLRVKEGLCYREIGERLGVSTSTAHAWCVSVRAGVREDAADLIESVTTEALERVRRAAAIASQEYEATRDPKHATALVACEKRLADLVGADAPRRSEVSGPGGGPIRVHSMDDDELARLAEG